MASVNNESGCYSPHQDGEWLALYRDEKLSIPDVSKATGIPMSTIRFRLHKLGELRTRKEGIQNAAALGKLSSMKGKTRIFTDEWKENISTGHRKRADRFAAGTTVKKNGYIEFTRGEHKFRGQHVVVVEEIIGRRLMPNECVHHKDCNRQNNNPDNLQLMTRSEHAQLHALENHSKRERDKYGRFC